MDIENVANRLLNGERVMVAEPIQATDLHAIVDRVSRGVFAGKHLRGVFSSQLPKELNNPNVVFVPLVEMLTEMYKSPDANR